MKVPKKVALKPRRSENLRNAISLCLKASLQNGFGVEGVACLTSFTTAVTLLSTPDWHLCVSPGADVAPGLGQGDCPHCRLLNFNYILPSFAPFQRPPFPATYFKMSLWHELWPFPDSVSRFGRHDETWKREAAGLPRHQSSMPPFVPSDAFCKVCLCLFVLVC